MPEISVIIPVYNTQQYLNKSIRSVLKQSFPDFELILVNDGSMDFSLLFCKAFAEKDSRIRILDLPHCGVTAARVAGIKAARGRYISFVDSDDCVEEKFLEHLYMAASQNNADISVCHVCMKVSNRSSLLGMPVENGVFVGEELEKIKYTSLICTENLRISIMSYLVNKLVKRELMEENLSYMDPATLSEDAVLMNACFLDSKKVCVIENSDYYYERRRNSITTSLHENLCEELSVFRKEMYRLLKEKGYDDLKAKVDAYVVNIIYLAYFEEEMQRPSTITDEFAELIAAQEDGTGDGSYQSCLRELKALYASGRKSAEA